MKLNIHDVENISRDIGNPVYNILTKEYNRVFERNTYEDRLPTGISGPPLGNPTSPLQLNYLLISEHKLYVMVRNIYKQVWIQYVCGRLLYTNTKLSFFDNFFYEIR